MTAPLETLVHGIAEVIEDAEVSYCATFTSVNARGDEVWVQVVGRSINAQYPFEVEPMAQLRALGVRDRPALELITWQAASYVTLDAPNASARDLAFVVNELFVKVLGCLDGQYELAVTIESHG